MLDVERLQFLDLYSFELRFGYFEKILEFTSSSYSFYWLEAILNVMIYKDTIEFDEILDEMISLAYEDVVEKGYHLSVDSSKAYKRIGKCDFKHSKVFA